MTLIALGPALNPGMGSSPYGGGQEVIEIEFAPYGDLASVPTPAPQKQVAQASIQQSTQQVEQKKIEPPPKPPVKEPITEIVEKTPEPVKEVVEKTPEPEVIPEPILATDQMSSEEDIIQEVAYEEPEVTESQTLAQSSAWKDVSENSSQEELLQEVAETEASQDPLVEETLGFNEVNSQETEIQEEAEKAAEEANETALAQTVAETKTSSSEETPTPSDSSQSGSSQVVNTPQSGSPIVVRQNFLQLRQLSGNQPPTYSREMRLNRMEGRGQLVYFVNRNGQVSNIRLVKSTGHPALDQAAVEAFSQYKFVPGQEGYTVHNFEFSLRGPAEPDAGRLRTTLSN